MSKKKIVILSLVLSSFCASAAIPNLLYYDKKWLHFGFSLGYNQMLFNVKLKENRLPTDTVLAINSFYAPGFSVGLISDVRFFSDYVNLRFLPGLSFSQKTIEYNFKNGSGDVLSGMRKRTTESVYLDIPLEFKIRAKRYNNFRPYIILGGRYTFDLASLRKKEGNDTEEEDKIALIYPHDFMYTMGAGFDFYLTYFKFAIELKMSVGVNDLFYNEKNIYTNSIDQITSRLFNFTLTFE